MDQFQQRKFKIGEGRGGAFDGGVITVRDEALLPFGGYSTMNNVKKWHPGIQKRRGMYALHNTDPTPGASFEFIADFSGYTQKQDFTWAGARAAPANLAPTSGAFVRAVELAPGSLSFIRRTWLDFDSVSFPPGAIFGVTLTVTNNTPLAITGTFTVSESLKAFGTLTVNDHDLFTGPALGTPTVINGGTPGTKFVMPFSAAGVNFIDTTVRSSGQAQFCFLDVLYDQPNIPSGGGDSECNFADAFSFLPADRPLLTITMAA